MLSALSIFSYLLIFAILMALAYRDAKEYILPDYLNAALAITFTSFHIMTGWQIITPVDALLGSLMGGGLLLLIRTLADKFYRADSLGLGDVKLMAAAGLGLGHPGVLMALVVGATAGLLHGLGMACADKKKHQRNIQLDQVNVPAGVGLAIGIAVVMLYQFGFEWLDTR